jgi:hypothetical protein
MVPRFPRWAIQSCTPFHYHDHAFLRRTVNGPCMIVLQAGTVVPHALSPDR